MGLNRAAGVPLYVQLREQLRSELAAIDPGQQIPVEAELERKFNVSRITVRRAVEDLVGEGFLLRQQGRGTFVQRPKLTHELSRITSWTEQLQVLGFSPKTTNRKILREVAPMHVAEALRLNRLDEVLRIQRVRLSGREPISYMINYVPVRLVPDFSAAKFSVESLYELLERDYGLVPDIAVDTVSTRPASEEEAKALRIERKIPIMSVRRISYLSDGTPLELAVVASRGDRYQYEVTLHGRPSMVAAKAPWIEWIMGERKGL